MEGGEEVGVVETEEPNATYTGEVTILELMVEDIEDGIFETTHAVDAEDDGETLPPDVSQEVSGDELAEYVETLVAEVSEATTKVMGDTDFRKLETPQSVPDNAIRVDNKSDIPTGGNPYIGDRGGIYYLPAGEKPEIDEPETQEEVAEGVDAEPDEISEFNPDMLDEGDEIVVKTTAGEKEAVEVQFVTPDGGLLVEDNVGNQITIADGRDSSGEIKAIANVGTGGPAPGESAETREDSINQIENDFVVDADSLDLEDAPDEVVGSIAEGFSEVIGEEGLPPVESVRFLRDDMRELNASAQASPSGEIFLGDRFAETDNNEERRERNVERVEYNDDVDRFEVDPTQKGIILHEYGHILQFELNDAGLLEDALDAFGVNGNTFLLGNFSQGSKQEAKNISQYATSDPGEKFAESFVAYHKGETERLSNEQINIFDELTTELEEQ